MKKLKALVRRPAVAGLLLAVCGLAAASIAETAANVPNIFNPTESQFQSQTHFLTFLGNDTAGENVKTATAYYNAIDPTSSKRDFPDWLVKAGFISDVSEWNPSGPQQFACNLPGCDFPRGTHGFGIINADAHAIVLNAADLGFVRNQFIRCVPSCTDPNPKIYTYLENYPVAPFATSSGFPVHSGYPTPDEARAAIQSAVTRPLGAGIQRIADVAFEWAPPATNPSSPARFGQLYAFLFFDPGGASTPVETIAFNAVAPDPTNDVAPNLTTGLLEPFNIGDPFPPNLDGLGFKQHPGVCFICHGGKPPSLTASGAYPHLGNVKEFRFLPLDNRNLMFTSDAGSEPTSRLSQEPHIKLYNQAVLKTVTRLAETDDQGITRVPHLRDVIVGWYAASASDKNMTSPIQKDFIPAAWREPPNGTAPAGSERLYTTVLGPSCRSCHFNRELSLDFGTVKNFDAFRQDVLDLVLLPLCQAGNPEPGKRPMPLAHLTYQRFWEANASPQTLFFGTGSNGVAGPVTLQDTAEQIAQHFGFSGTAAYCAAVH
jgi:hypothetical protein